MTAIEERLAKAEQLIADLQDKLLDVVDDLSTTTPAPPPPPPPRRWADRAGGDDWAALVDWVDNLVADYSIDTSQYIAPCWPRHAGVVEELAGLWRSWIAAVTADAAAGAAGADDLTTWHDKCLWPCLKRLGDPSYSTAECRSSAKHSHIVHESKPRLTNRDAIPPPVTP